MLYYHLYIKSIIVKFNILLEVSIMPELITFLIIILIIWSIKTLFNNEDEPDRKISKDLTKKVHKILNKSKTKEKA